MSTSRPKQMAGPDFLGTDELECADLGDWVTAGGVEASKTTLDNFNWEGQAVVTAFLQLSPDNKKVTNGGVRTVGELMKSQKDFKASRLFPTTDKDLKIGYTIEEASTFTFSKGTLTGDIIDGHNPGIAWHVFKKGPNPGQVTTIAETQYDTLGIGNLSIKPYLIPVSPHRCKLSILIFPLAKDKLLLDHPECDKAAFPGLELTSMEIDIFPKVDQENDKTWGSPVIPLIQLGGKEDEFPNIPSTEEIRAKLFFIMRTAMKPDIKRDLVSLKKAWQAIKDSGPTKMKERHPDLIWPSRPLVANQTQGRMPYFLVRLGFPPNLFNILPDNTS